MYPDGGMGYSGLLRLGRAAGLCAALTYGGALVANYGANWGSEPGQWVSLTVGLAGLGIAARAWRRAK